MAVRADRDLREGRQLATRGIALSLAAATLVLYGWRLEYSPIHLHYDEIFFGLQAQSIQSTGRDLNGRLLPVYFQLENTFNWYQPMAVYWTALVLMVAPLSDYAIRFATVLVATANVVLMFFAARLALRSDAWAVVAAVLLMLTPAHFIHGRIAMDYVYPLPFILGWLIGTLRYLDTAAPRPLAIGALCLGFGFFSYIAGTALSPMYLALTLAVLWWRRRPWRDAGLAIAAFAIPIAAGAVFSLAYPDTVADLMQKYGVASGQPAVDGLDPLQRVREAVNTRTVSDALNHYWRFFSPGYLFVTGGANLTNSTREAGVFLAPIAVLLIAGFAFLVRHRSVLGAILVFGLVTAPIPATLMPEDYTIDRHLATLLFAILIATIGAQRIWMAHAERTVSAITRPLALLLGAVAIVYFAMTIARGQTSASAPALLVVAIAVYVIGMMIDRTHTWRPIAAALLVLVPIMFVPFLGDYFDGYRIRAAAWFGGNIRGAIERIIQLDGEAPATAIFISRDIPYIESYWRFYLATLDRPDLIAKTRWFDVGRDHLESITPNSYVLAAGNDDGVRAWSSSGALTQIAAITDGDLAEQFSIYRR